MATGLLRVFRRAHLQRRGRGPGKPAPDLFLHAASAMSVAPGGLCRHRGQRPRCAGARAAGMTVLGYATRTPAGRLGDADATFSAMDELPGLLPRARARLSRRAQGRAPGLATQRARRQFGLASPYCETHREAGTAGAGGADAGGGAPGAGPFGPFGPEAAGTGPIGNRCRGSRRARERAPSPPVKGVTAVRARRAEAGTMPPEWEPAPGRAPVRPPVPPVRQSLLEREVGLGCGC